MSTQSEDEDSSGLAPEEREALYRVDERVEHMDERLDTVAEQTEGNAEDIDELQGKVNRNTTILNGMTVGGVAVVTWIADKLTRLFP